ncbi:MHYT domain-containing protein [Telluria antibiotica]|uniref:MHYT domain-containing protein n=1 Tax=Telluria antibiotica TaxID=2717319 RepID=UPI001E336B6E|nr:MHYT domain-containing protein [Telluria antibiotica]
MGAAAMRLQPGIVYDPLLFALSVLVAIVASALALWIAFRLRRSTPDVLLPRVGAAVVMGFAIMGVHYTGMAAANLPADSVCMATRIVLATFCVLGLALIASVFDARLEANARILAMSQATAADRQQLLEREHRARPGRAPVRARQTGRAGGAGGRDPACAGTRRRGRGRTRGVTLTGTWFRVPASR